MHTNPRLSRRALTCALALGTAALAMGCGHLRQESALDASLAALREALADAGGDELSTVCDQIAATTQATLDTHNQFLRRFNRRAANDQTGQEPLQALVADYQSSIRTQRNALLALQDQLYQQIPTEQWPAVRDQLLDTGRQFMDDSDTRPR